ncbi:hypothetical protein [uncultured Trichococcus sp.]|uniref:hypothetical protein n=1 Tax=uncultured Trichococcus sp. TaxID=189665 RepID=UPI00259576DB|nr:hypothetical protein [uncultured Trichococcus sp.]
MRGFKKERRSDYTDLATVESQPQRNDLTAEEFPEGPYGSPLMTETLGKSEPWRIDQRPPNRFSYEYREFHKQIPRDYPAAHLTHDENNSEGETTENKTTD